MMYLSTLFIDLGTNPDRPRPGRLWLRNLYRVHQRLSMAFPSDAAKCGDPDFLQPFDPKEFDRQLRVPRTTDKGFLFRIDPQLGGGRAVILVQSAAEPDWEYAFHNARHMLAAQPEWKIFDPRFQPGQRLRFRLLANPVRKITKDPVLSTEISSMEESQKPKKTRVPAADLSMWLERRAEPGWSAPKNSEDKQFPPGFRLFEIMNVQAGYVYVNDSMKKDGGRRYRSARYEGILEVTDPDRFRSTVIKGIGPAKAFGFGLLSVMPVRSLEQAEGG